LPVLDHFGRAEATAVSAALYGIGFICTGLSRDVIFYAVRLFSGRGLRSSAAQIAKTIGSLGGTGLQLCIAVLIADTTTLSNRALVSSTIAIPWLLTIWVGPVLASAALEHGQAGQRAFYIAFGIAVPLLCLPLVFTLRRTYARVSHALLRKISRSDLSIDDVGDSMQYMKEILQQHKDFEEAQTFGSRARQAWQQIDAPGIALLTLSGAFILLPFSLAATRPESWSDPAVYLFIALGVVCGYLFRRHERTAAFPFISERLLYNRTVRAGCALGLFHFVCQFTYESYVLCSLFGGS
jgi:MFS family permease